jgi:hypothetical protein
LISDFSFLFSEKQLNLFIDCLNNEILSKYYFILIIIIVDYSNRFKPGNQSSYLEQVFQQLELCQQVISERAMGAGK